MRSASQMLTQTQIHRSSIGMRPREQHRLDVEYLHLLLPNPPIRAGNGIIRGRENRSPQSQESGLGASAVCVCGGEGVGVMTPAVFLGTT
jgi:hypothetical protein